MWPWNNNPSSTDDGFSLSSDEEDIHTPENPYCGNLSCWCHTNLDYHHNVTDVSLEISVPVEVERARSFFGLFGS